MELRDKYPGNKKKVVKKVVTGSVGRLKKTTGKKLLETFFAEDFKSVKNYVIREVLIPSAKSLISDTFHSAIDALFNGGKKTHIHNRPNGTFVNYSSFSQQNPLAQKYANTQTNRPNHIFDNLVYATRGEAEAVLAHLVDLIIDYQEATIADLYELSNISSSHVDRAYGWVDLSTANIRPVQGGYLLQLPKAIALR